MVSAPPAPSRMLPDSDTLATVITLSAVLPVRLIPRNQRGAEVRFSM